MLRVLWSYPVDQWLGVAKGQFQLGIELELARSNLELEPVKPRIGMNRSWTEGGTGSGPVPPFWNREPAVQVPNRPVQVHFIKKQIMLKIQKKTSYNSL